MHALLQIKDKETTPMDTVKVKKDVIYRLISVSTYMSANLRFVFPFLYNRSLDTLRLWACVYK